MVTISVSAGFQSFPNTSNVEPAGTPILWPPANAPTVRVLSVHDSDEISDPTAHLDTASDLQIESNSPVDILLETTNLPIEGTVRLRVAPKFGFWETQWHTATYVSGGIDQAVWRVTTTLLPGFTVLQARATAP